MAYIGPLPAETFTSFATQEFSTSATTSYTLNHPVTNENEIALFINNVRQQPGSGKAYTATGTALTLSAATASTDTMYAVFLGRALQTVNPAGGSVGSSQITAEMITGQTALAATPADTDEFLVSDGGVLKRIDYSLIKGAFRKLITTTASNSSTIEFTSTYLTTAYQDYMVVCSGLRPSTDGGQDLYMRVSVDGGSSFKSGSDYVYGLDGEDQSSEFETDSSAGTTQFLLNNNQFGASTGEVGSTTLHLFDPLNQNSDNQYFHFTMSTVNLNASSATLSQSHGGGAYKESGSENDPINGLQFYFASGNISSGKITLYGRAT